MISGNVDPLGAELVVFIGILLMFGIVEEVTVKTSLDDALDPTLKVIEFETTPVSSSHVVTRFLPLKVVC